LDPGVGIAVGSSAVAVVGVESVVAISTDGGSSVAATAAVSIAGAAVATIAAAGVTGTGVAGGADSSNPAQATSPTAGKRSKMIANDKRYIDFLIHCNQAKYQVIQNKAWLCTEKGTSNPNAC
jgi:hypothetical protein